MIGDDQSGHDFANRHGTNAHARVMAAFGDDFGFIAANGCFEPILLNFCNASNGRYCTSGQKAVKSTFLDNVETRKVFVILMPCKRTLVRSRHYDGI